LTEIGRLQKATLLNNGLPAHNSGVFYESPGKLKNVAQPFRRLQSKTDHRHTRLLDKLDDQLGTIHALIDGHTYLRDRKMWREDETGAWAPVERQKGIWP